MDELNLENQYDNQNNIDQAEKAVEQNESQGSTLADDISAVEEKPIEEKPAQASEPAQEVFQVEQKPQEENFFKEENYYDSHPFPQQTLPIYQQGNVPPIPQQPYGQPYGQQYQQRPQQYQQPYQQPYMQQQAPYQPQQQRPAYPQQQVPPYNPQQGYYQHPNYGQFVPQPQQPQPQQAQQPKYAQPNYYTAPKIDNANKTNITEGKKGLSAGAIVGIIVGILVIIGLICAVAILDSKDKGSDNNNSNTTSQAQSKGDSKGQTKIEIPVQSKPNVDEKYKETDGRYTTQGIAKAVSPCVVGIVTYGEGQSLTPIGQASGIIISTDGYIITNAHVVEGANAQKVILTDETEFEAKLIGKDTKSDLAVLKIDPKGKELSTAQIGDSSQIELGEQVMAIGNPGGLSNSITGGFVSGLNRQIKGSDEGLAMNCIQTDAAVNPGNSGGALVNMYGQIVGIISSKIVETDYEGIGFAIAINDALPIIKDIMSKGYVSGRVRIGIVFNELTDTTADMNDVKPGLYIAQIDPSCDIATSGLKVDDIITEMNGKKVYSYETVMKAIEGLKPGDTVTAKVYRKSIVGDETEFEIKFKLMEDTPQTTQTPQK